ncbi:hypothetical protein CDL15_Pgr007738 [Punica granatum]|uniref:Methionyl/Valyl/Leucyl/Isoleucyl-tRNA synthetase anticodon-binding domain-containing protein n=1 Tax=Punica granatum TaxID=22663 RepID=A0A218XAG5_PUNGR|nr:hypothetical protein CDL15_Pgr007738 [Punica granatum]
MDVQTRLIAPFWPHYAEECVWRELLKRDGFVIKAGWPVADDSPDPTLKSANNYLKSAIVSMSQKKKQLLDSKKKGNKKGGQVATLTEEKHLRGLIYMSMSNLRRRLESQVLEDTAAEV